MLSTRVAKRAPATRKIALLAISALSVFLLAVLSLSAQHESHEEHEAVGWVPGEILERPVPLRQGIGKVHEEVTTSSLQAQAFYDQGFAYLHSYVWIEAARSFNQALRLDPSLAMAYIGLSDIYVGLQDVPSARAALEKAESLATRVTEREKQRIQIRARQVEFLEAAGDMQKYFAYRKAINDALAASPSDPWLWILRGFADEGTAVAHGQSGQIDTIAFYKTALAFSPENFAAHHYLVHSFENIGRTKEALEESDAYVRLAPAIPHAHHMRGHGLRRTGRTEEAIEEFHKADELEAAYYRSENIAAKYDWHHAHNLSLMAMSCQALGQMKAAEQLLREAFSLPIYTDLAEFNRREWPEFLLGRGRAQEALDASQDLVKSQWAMGRFAGHTLAGRSLLALNRTEEAKGELSQAEQELEQLPAAAMGSLPNAGVLRAEILLSEKNWAQGESLMKQIAEKVRGVPGPDAWSEALFQLESIASMARQVGDWVLAKFMAQQMIEQDPSYAGGYYALALANDHRGEADAARQEFATAWKLWSKADSDLPELERIRQKLAAQR